MEGKHRYNAALPASMSSGAIKEGPELASLIHNGLRTAAGDGSSTPDFDDVMKQLKRLNALAALKYQLPDQQWADMVTTLSTLAHHDALDMTRQAAVLNSVRGLLRRKRDVNLVTIEWRPLWKLLQASHQSHVPLRSRASAPLVSAHLLALVGLIRRASRYFPASAVAEIAAAVTPSLDHIQSHAVFNSLASLYLFLPPWATVSQLPPGTGQQWVRVWARVNHVGTWDALWAAIFARLAHPSRLSLSGAGGLEWGALVPFLATRLQAVLNAPVANSHPVQARAPEETLGLLGAHHPNSVDSFCKLLTRILTVTVPASVAGTFGDDPAEATAPVMPEEGGSGMAVDSEQPSPRQGALLTTYVGDASPTGAVERLLRALASFFYPTSAHVGVFMGFLRAFCARLAKRIGREAGAAQAAMVTGWTPAAGTVTGGPGSLPGYVPAPLSKEILTRLTDAILPLAVLGLYAPPDQRGALGDASRCLRLLSSVAPARVAAEVVGFATAALDPSALNQVHLAPNAMVALSVLTRPLLYPVPHLGAALPTLAELALPGIDPNDAGKTQAALGFFSALLTSVPLIDPADAEEAAVAANRAGRDVTVLELPLWHPASPHYSLPALAGSAVPTVPVGPFASRFLLGGVVGATGPADTPAGGAAGAAATYGLGSAGVAAGSSEMSVEGEEDDEGPPPEMGDYGASPTKRASSASTAGGFAPGAAGGVSASGPLSELPPSVRRMFTPLREGAPERLCGWALSLLDRVFRVLEAREKPSKARGAGGAKAGDGLSAWLGWMLALLFAQMSPRLLKAACDRVYGWVSQSGPLDSVKDVATLLGALAASAPKDTAERFLPFLLERASAPGASPAVRAWFLSLAQGMVRELGPVLVPLLPRIASAVRAGYASDDKATRKAAGKVLRHTLASLLSTYSLSPVGSHNKADMAAGAHTLWAKWANPCALVDGAELAAAGLAEGAAAAMPPSPDLLWHVPTQSEREGALSLMSEFLVAPLQRLAEFEGSHTASPTPGGKGTPVAAAASATTTTRSEARTTGPATQGAGGIPPPSPSLGAQPAASYIPVTASEGERMRVDLEMVHAAVRGGVYALTDGASSGGDDDIIALGTAGQALVWDAAAGKAVYATGDAPAAGGSLRHMSLLRTAGFLRFLNRHPDLSRDTKALNAASKLGTRLIAGRGPRLSKSTSAVGNVRLMRRSDRDAVSHARLRAFVKGVRAHAARAQGASAGRDGSVIARTAAGTTLHLTGGVTSQTSPRTLLIARVRIHMQRRVAESVFSIPRALHSGRGAGALGDAQDTSAAGDESEDVGVDIGDSEDFAPVDIAAEEGDEAPTPSGDAGPLRPSSPFAASAFAHPELRHSVSAFGRAAVSKLSADEAPYAVMAASLAGLTTHSYDGVRRKGQGHLITVISVLAWLRRPAQLVGLYLLEKDIATAVSASANARVGALQAAAESYLASHPVAPSPALAHLPPAPGGVPAMTLPPAAMAALTASVSSGTLPSGAALPPAAVTAMRAHLASLATDAGTTTAGGPMVSPAVAAPPGTSPAVGPIGMSPITAGGAAAAVGGFAGLKTPSGGSPAPATPLAYTDVAGHTFMSFGLGAPRSLTRSWPVLERALNILLRTGPIIRALPIEKQAAALQGFTLSALNLLQAWTALDARPSMPGAAKKAELRKRLLKYLVRTAAPAAYGDDEEADATVPPPVPPSPATGSTTATEAQVASFVASLRLVAAPDETASTEGAASGGEVGSNQSSQGSSPPAAQQQRTPGGAAPARTGGPAPKRRTVLCADGSRSESAAPLHSSGPLHWRYELLAATWALILLAPPRPEAYTLAIDEAAAATTTSAAGPRSIEEDGFALAPEPVWLWALSNSLSDVVPLRAQSMEFLLSLLHSRHAASCAGHDVDAAAPLPRVTATLSSPAFWSQFVAAVALDHPQALAKEEGSGGALGSGLHEMLKPLDCVRVFREHARISLRGGAVSLLHHMFLFQLAAQAFPACLPPALSALADLAAASTGKSAAVPGSVPAAAGGSGSSAEGGDVDMTTGGAAAPNAGAAATSGHDQSTLRVRQATVAEAFGGFLRALSAAKTPGTAPEVDGSRAGIVRFTSADASLAALASSTVGGGAQASETDALILRTLEVAAPILDTVGTEWADDWCNALRFACRQRHPSQVAPVARYIFANASTSLAAGDQASLDLPSGDGVSGPNVNAAFLATLLQRVRDPLSSSSPASSAAGTAPEAPAHSSSSSSSSFVAQHRWMSLCSALLDEALVTADGNGPSGSLPGVTHREEASKGYARVRVQAQAAADFCAEAGVVPARIAATSLARQLLPSLLRCLPHRFRPVRQGVATLLVIALEATWAAADLPQPSTIAAAGGAADVTSSPIVAGGRAKAIEAPASCDRPGWVPALLAYLLHVGLAAIRKSTASAAADAAAGEAPAPSASAEAASAAPQLAPPAAATPAAPAGADDKWDRRALDSLLLVLQLICEGEGVVVAAPTVALLPILLQAQQHADRELAAVAGWLLGRASQNLSLDRLHPGDSAAEAGLYRSTVGLFREHLPAASTVSAAPPPPIPAPAVGTPSPASAAEAAREVPGDLVSILLEMLEELATPPPSSSSSGGGAGEADAGDVPATPTATGAAAAAPQAPSGGSWYARRGVLSFLTPVRAHALQYLTRDQDADVLQLIEGRLADKQVEVQQAASEALVGVLMTLPHAMQARLGRAYVAMAGVKLPKRVTMPAPGAPATELEAYRKYKQRLGRLLTKRHGGVLGAGAVIRAHPFDVPPFLPPLISAMARHAGDPEPVKKSVRTVFESFRHTHNDAWELHKARFTAEQLADLSELSMGPSYYA